MGNWVISPTKWSEKTLLIYKISGRGPPCIYPENSNGWLGKWFISFWNGLFFCGQNRPSVIKKVTLTSWWSQPTHLKNILWGQIGSSPHKIVVTIFENETKTFSQDFKFAIIVHSFHWWFLSICLQFASLWIKWMQWSLLRNSHFWG